ncbi:hypothetical protein ACJJTC_001681 [Scirpophaga incertulas]
MYRDSGVSAAEFTYGKTIRLPGDFYENAKITSVDSEYLQKLRDSIKHLKPRPTSHGNSRSIFLPSELSSCKSVFVRNDLLRKSLQPPYDGPYEVISRRDKTFVIRIGGRESTISIDRLKPAYLINNENESSDSFNLSDSSNVYSNLDNEATSSKVLQPRTTRSGRVIKTPVRFA